MPRSGSRVRVPSRALSEKKSYESMVSFYYYQENGNVKVLIGNILTKTEKMIIHISYLNMEEQTDLEP